MEEFKFINYCTVYTAEGDIRKKRRGEDACFSDVFQKLWGDKQYHIKYDIFICNNRKMLDNNFSNYCILSRSEIRKHLNHVKEVVNFKYKITADKYKDYTGLNIHLDVDDWGTAHKFILTWTRYMYEFPFNMQVKEIQKLREISPFKSISSMNLFNVVSASTYKGGDIHAISLAGKFMTKNRVKKKLPKTHRLNEIYKNKSNIEQPEANFNSLETWNSPEEFQKRIPYYKKAYDKLRK